MTVLTMLAIRSVATRAIVLLKRYSLPVAAELIEVEFRVLPGLAVRLAKQGLFLEPLIFGVRVPNFHFG